MTEDIEVKLYDLLANKTYDSLSAEEKTFIETQLGKDAFNSLKTVNAIVVGLNQTRKTEIENELLKLIPTPKTKTYFWQKHIPIWQAASLLILAGILSLAWMSTSQKSAQLAQQIDTVWLEKPIEKVIVDTFYVLHEPKTNNLQKSKQLLKANPQEFLGSNRKEMQFLTQLNVSGPGDIHNQRNRIQGNSLAEDTLPLNVGFVGL